MHILFGLHNCFCERLFLKRHIWLRNVIHSVCVFNFPKVTNTGYIILSRKAEVIISLKSIPNETAWISRYTRHSHACVLRFEAAEDEHLGIEPVSVTEAKMIMMMMMMITKIYQFQHCYDWENVYNFLNKETIEILINALNLAYFCQYGYVLIY